MKIIRPRSILGSEKFVEFPLWTYFALVLKERGAMFARIIERNAVHRDLHVSCRVGSEVAVGGRSLLFQLYAERSRTVHSLCVRVAVRGRAVGVESGRGRGVS